jgi:Flp pilus assembly protein TadB
MNGSGIVGAGGLMAIPKEKNLAVQLVVTMAFCVAPFGLFHAIWYGVTDEHASPWVAGLVSVLAGAVFFWWYGYMQRKQRQK